MNSKMGVQITKVDLSNKDSANATVMANHKNGPRCKQKYTMLDLPYPPGGKNSENWKLLNAMVISWARAQEDPFGTNSRLDVDINMLWESVFPGSTLDEQGRQCALVVVCIFLGLCNAHHINYLLSVETPSTIGRVISERLATRSSSVCCMKVASTCVTRQDARKSFWMPFISSISYIRNQMTRSGHLFISYNVILNHALIV